MKKRTTSASYFFSTSRMVKKLPSDFGHLLVVHAHEAVVHPVIHELAPVRALALCDLVLVVRKLQVRTAAVNVEMLAQQCPSAIAEHSICQPGRPLPHFESHLTSSGFALLGMLPQHEVERIAACRRSPPRARPHAGLRAICRKACRSRRTCAPRNSRRHPPPGTPVRSFPACCDHFQHLRDILGGARLVIGALARRARRHLRASHR